MKKILISILLSLTTISASFASQSPSWSILEFDKCHSLHLSTEVKNRIQIISLCDNQSDDFFEKIWLANGEIIAEIKSSDQSLYEAESWKDYDFSSLLHNKQQIYRSYSSNNDLAMIIDDAKLYSEVLTYMKAKQDFSIVLLNNSSWSTFFFPGNSEFQSYVSSSRPSSHLELIKNKYIYYENVLASFRQLLPSDYNWVCNPQALTTMVKFVNKERLKNVTIDSDLCLALRTASVDNILLTDPSLNIYSESLIEKMLKMNALEKFIWKLVLFINNSQSDQLIPSINEFNELSTEDQLFVRYFIRDDLLAFSDKRVEVLGKLFELFNFFFKDEITDLYSLAVLQNCSSNKKVQILEAQKNVDTLESVLTIEQVAEGRIVYLANRVRHIEKRGYVNGPLGIIGASNAHDYCVNLTTTLHKIQADERISDQRSWINTAKALIVFSKISENISNVTGEKESNQLLILFDKYLQQIEVGKDISNLWLLELKTSIYLKQKDYKKTLKTWQKYLETTGVSNNSVEVQRREALLTFNILSQTFAHATEPQREYFYDFLLGFAEKVIFPKSKYVSTLNYFDDFNFVENNLEQLENIAYLISLMKQNSKVDSFLFRSLQRKFIQPETLSLTRYLKIPEKSDKTKNIQILLGNRAQKIEEFYKQLSAFSNNEITEREKLEIIFRQFDESKMDQQKSVANEVLASGQLRLKKSTVKNIAAFSLSYTLYQPEIWNMFKEMKISQPTKKPVNYFQEKSNNKFKYDPKKTNQLLDEIVAVDQKIFETEPQLTPILQNSPISIKEVMSLLKPDQVLIFISTLDENKKLIRFSLNRKSYQRDDFFISDKLRRCMSNFRDLILGQQNLSFECNDEFKKIYFSENTEFYNNIKEIIYIVDNKLTFIPPTLIFDQKKIKSNSKVSSKSNARGLKPTDLSQEKNLSSSYSWLWQKYSFKYVPSPNSLRSFQFLNKYKTSSNENFLGIGVSKIPRIGFDAMEEEKLLLDQVSDIPFAEIEINKTKKIWGNNFSKVLINESATKENLKVFSGQRSKILSIATHSFKPEDIRYYSPSFLLLHPDKTKSFRSMQLTAKDIINLRLNADYVFLSACETIGSRNFSLEDTHTLASAFLYNSANSVLVSLWPIDDEATQVLMEYVIRLLKNNSEMGLNIALSKSIEKLIKLGYEHPFFWAGFMVIGKG